MKEYMKRKQFHLTVAEEQILYELAKKYNVSEAEIVRTAIREYGKNHELKENSLLKMAREAQKEKHDLPDDLSERHDDYLTENENHEEK